MRVSKSFLMTHSFVQTRPLINSTIYKRNLSLFTKNLWDTVEEIMNFIIIIIHVDVELHILIIILSDLVDYSFFIFSYNNHIVLQILLKKSYNMIHV